LKVFGGYTLGKGVAMSTRRAFLMFLAASLVTVFTVGGKAVAGDWSERYRSELHRTLEKRWERRGGRAAYGVRSLAPYESGLYRTWELRVLRRRARAAAAAVEAEKERARRQREEERRER
jgi:hypothetical protein